MTDLSEQRRLLDAACEIAREAGRAILEVYGRADFAVARKSDDSPLTEADQVAHRIISGALAALDGSIPVLSEESLPGDHAMRRSWSRYWLVDPLDGTKEFVKRNGEFTVNIALVDEHRAVLGAVLAPVLDRMYSGAAGLGAWRADAGGAPQPIAVRARRRDAVACRRQPQPPYTRARAVPRRPAAARDHRHGQLAENLPGRRGRGGRLSAAGADVRMGHGRGAGYPRKCGRAYDRPCRPAAAVQLQRRFVESALPGLWRPAAGLVGTDPEYSWTRK